MAGVVARAWQVWVRREGGSARRQLLLRDGDRCWLCGCLLGSDVTIDHVQPKSKFPELMFRLSNMRLAHRACNAAKKDRLVVAEVLW